MTILVIKIGNYLYVRLGKRMNNAMVKTEKDLVSSIPKSTVHSLLYSRLLCGTLGRVHTSVVSNQSPWTICLHKRGVQTRLSTTQEHMMELPKDYVTVNPTLFKKTQQHLSSTTTEEQHFCHFLTLNFLLIVNVEGTSKEVSEQAGV